LSDDHLPADTREPDTPTRVNSSFVFFVFFVVQGFRL
jgi:hypothetical protein